MKFTVDHPFLYLILYNDAILFAGTYTKWGDNKLNKVSVTNQQAAYHLRFPVFPAIPL